MVILLYTILWILGMYLFYNKLQNLFLEIFDDLLSMHDVWYMSNAKYTLYKSLFALFGPIFVITGVLLTSYYLIVITWWIAPILWRIM
jgi:hypothetical protein